ncbi:DUF2207 domain-containing protein [Devosia sp. MC521]|uniref:DUF2207 domain-containing protein n=1 Tax=Devosia sp. MC521 TaxID=2759954 RepID=UPI0015F7DCBA|nr:DUF2207 domain-containing protein [Devosia sp. MC521]MBJ6988232.1 DUF2207 domain-containing protein [Devosia sp. MC521]QMW63252.1 DUF2207 domain-containing protein [Devosia sp. MC521]
MSALLRFFSAVILTALLVMSASAREEIRSLIADVTLATDGSVHVTETLVVNAEGLDIRRGIYRDVPVTMRSDDGSKIRIGLEVEAVTRNGADEPFRVERMGDFRRIWIGDSESFVPRGLHTYTITYTMPRMARPSADGDELYWNATGNYWIFPILSAEARVRLPDGAIIQNAVGYTGDAGSSEQNVTISRRGDNAATIKSNRVLGPGEGLTFAISFQKGIVSYPQGTDALWQNISDNRDVLLSIGGVVLLLLYNFTAWLRVGRDPAKGTIIPLFYPPEGFSPALTHYVNHWGFAGQGWKAMTAGIFSLGVKGLVKIDNTSKKLVVTNTGRKPDEALPSGEQILFDYFTKKGTVTFDQANGSEIGETKGAFVNAITLENRDKWFKANFGFALVSYALTALMLGAMVLFDIIEIEWLVLAGVIGIFATFISAMLFNVLIKGNWIGRIILVVWGGIFIANAGTGFADMFTDFPLDSAFIAAASMVLISIIFTILMRAPTVQGRKVMDQIDGFKLYLETAEKNRLNIDAEPPMSVERFERILPFAIALGVEKPWSEHFEAEMARISPNPERGSTYAPGWYSGGKNFSSSSVSNAISAASAGMAAAMVASQPVQASSSGSSGGGFSGGGGGGGGGGGW